MKKEPTLLVIIMLLISMMSYSIVSGGKTRFEVDEDGLEKSSKLSDNSNVQDGRFITKLQWFSPNGELPGTYAEYLCKHPLTHACFTIPEDVNNNNVKFGNSISILVDEDLYTGITLSLNQYIADLELEGYSTVLHTVSGGTPEEIKSWVKDRYNAGSIGVVFIGDITAAWAEVSGSVFPCDLFYMDLDGKWRDRDRDGDYEVHTSGFFGDVGPELYVGRIYANTLTYDSEEKLVNDYLSKTHSYRVGQLGQPWRGLEYVDEDWYDMDVNLNNIYSTDVVRHDYGYYTTGMDYLDQMDLGQHFVQVCAHSYSGGHHFGTRPTESASYAHVYIYSPETRSAKLLLGCDDGIKIWVNGDNVYTNDKYGSWHKDAYKVDVTLKEGWNRLLCKISQEGGDYKFSARITNTNYNTFNDLEYQINDPELHGEEVEYIRSWLLNGFHQDAYDNFYDYLTTNYLGTDEASINPNEGDDMGGKTWTRYNSGNPYIDLSEYCDNADCGVCYAYARVIADADKSCQLWIGYDEGARVWLNGEEIVYDNRYGGFETDMTKLDVTLNSGENRLLIKISEWWGEHGFSATLCHSNGSRVDGLTYDSEPTPITYIGTWLINGPYPNADQSTRLNTDYLENEETVKPSQGDTAPQGTWERNIGKGCPFNLGGYFDHGGWVFSENIQNRDPPVLFYNLFACGPGRFTDENYLAGAYIFNTTYGLITVASSKSGSMLNFGDFTAPLSEGSSIGEAFYEWFNAQAPFLEWEKHWYYGMIVCGDPTLRVFPMENYPPYKPSITGMTRGKLGETYEYRISTTDPDGNDVYYYIKWDDGFNTEWFGPYSSGVEITKSHTWYWRDTYTVRVKAKDVFDAESPWGYLEVTMPRNKVINTPFLRFLEHHPNLFPILQKLLQKLGLF